MSNGRLGETPALAPNRSAGAFLCATGTAFSYGAAAGAPNRRPTCEPLTTAPITAADVEPLIAAALRCPTDDLTARVFQQHSAMQTCWHDAFFMAIFHADCLKASLQDHLSLFLTTLLEKGYSDLAYVEQKTVTIEDPYYGTYENIKRTQPYEKPSAIAAVFKERYPQLPLQFWELYCLALQRFLLLNYLVIKHPESSVKGSLFQRRASIAEGNFTTLHKNFKESSLKVQTPGLWCYDVSKLRITIADYIKFASGTYQIFPITTNPNLLKDIQAYYIWQEMTHVFSLFKCNGTWFVYDNEVGTAPFSAEDSSKLSAIPIVSMKVADAEEDATKVKYAFTLADTSIVSTLVTKTAETPEKTQSIRYGAINPASSFVIAQRVSEGGRRKTRSRRKQRRRKTRGRLAVKRKV
jgi:hypothetical protein